jgi:CRISPR-associated Csx10 family RAMP protein
MEKWHVTIEAMQPLSIAAVPDRESHWDTTIIIPGSTLRGAVAEEWKNRVGFEHSLTSRLFEEGRWRDAYPKGTTLATADLFYSKKTNKVKSILLDYVKNQLTSLRIDENDSLLPVEQGYSNSNLVLNQSVGIAISPTRNATIHGRLYSLSAIAEGTIFTADLSLPREALQLLNESDGQDTITFTCYIGKKRSSGYGKVKITFQEVKKDYEQLREDLLKRIKTYNLKYLENNEFDKGKWYISFISTSPMILLDRFLRYTSSLDWEIHICEETEKSEQLKKIFKEKGALIASWGTSSIRHGWNNAWNVPKQAEWVLTPGTIHLFKFTNLEAEEQNLLVDLFLQLEETGIGERREEGFGQIVVNKLNEDIHTESATVQEEDMFDSNELLEKAKQFALAIERSIKKSQLYQLLQYTDNEIVKEICEQHEERYIEKRLQRNSRNGWKETVDYNGKEDKIGCHLRYIVDEWQKNDGYKKAGEKARKFLQYVIGYYDIHRNN